MKNGSMPKPGRRSRIFLTLQQVVTFTRRLARGLAAGTPLRGCLRHMLEHERSLMLRDVENDCIESIVAGQVFSEVLERHPDVFDSCLTAILEPLGFGPTPLFAGKEPPDHPQALPNRLRRFADELDREVQQALTTLHTVAGPILAVVLMVLVASLVAVMRGS